MIVLMKTIAIILLTICLSSISQDQYSFGLSSSQVKAIVSSLKDRKLSEKDLIPEGFMKVAEARGDLNHDGIDDLALIIRMKADDDEAYGTRQAVLLFTGDRSGTFTFWKVGAHHFVDSNGAFYEESGIGRFEIRKNVLVIHSTTTTIKPSGGGGGCVQKWRNEKSGFRLIGLRVDKIDRFCACGDSIDTNYLTGDEILTSDRDADGAQTEKMKTTRTKGKTRMVLWDEFNYDLFCRIGK